MKTREAFKKATKVKNTDYGLFYSTEINGKKYGQAYKGKADKMERYLNFYHTLHRTNSLYKASKVVNNY